jgi:hypothetical protein
LYIVGEHIHSARSVREALLGFFPAENLPTNTWIGVSALAGCGKTRVAASSQPLWWAMQTENTFYPVM